MKHKQDTSQNYPTARKIKRDCSQELYRAIKRMNVYIEKKKISEAETYYTKMVITHYKTISELSQYRKKQIHWWDENCSEQLASILNVDRTAFVQAFTDAYLTRYS